MGCSCARRSLAASRRRRATRLAVPAGVAEARLDRLGGGAGGVGGDTHAPVPVGDRARIVLQDRVVDDERRGGAVGGQEGRGPELVRGVVLDEVAAEGQVDAVAAVLVDGAAVAAG